MSRRVTLPAHLTHDRAFRQDPCLFTVKRHALRLLTLAGVAAAADPYMIRRAFTVLIMHAVACLAVHVNILAWLTHRVAHCVPFPLLKAGAAGSGGVRRVFPLHLYIAFAAIPILIVHTIHRRTF